MSFYTKGFAPKEAGKSFLLQAKVSKQLLADIYRRQLTCDIPTLSDCIRQALELWLNQKDEGDTNGRKRKLAELQN